ncbi:sigma factor-like helix-turn-helix DNA-binding protein [Streptomyces sp. NPDC048415]|uniref:sigma factor-like helix-turn-helix DNA-binding protein n=1 Tax=Streptomyces sp. NPDC048415 TaxID=3154822 RepID=UPI00343F3D15
MTRERDRHILHLRFFEELTQAQIGERLGVSQMHLSRLVPASWAACAPECSLLTGSDCCPSAASRSPSPGIGGGAVGAAGIPRLERVRHGARNRPLARAVCWRRGAKG